MTSPYLTKPLRTERQARLDMLKARKARWEIAMWRRDQADDFYMVFGTYERDTDAMERLEIEISEMEENCDI